MDVPLLIPIYLFICLFIYFCSWSYGVLLYEIVTVGKLLVLHILADLVHDHSDNGKQGENRYADKNMRRS